MDVGNPSNFCTYDGFCMKNDAEKVREDIAAYSYNNETNG
jgi:hypothetical protein